MKLLATLALVLTTATALADVSLSEDKKTVTVDCAKDKEVSITGNHITVTLTGTCAKVSATGNNATITGSVTKVVVNGNSNTLALDGVDAISVMGNKNTISYKKPLAKKKTSVSNLGNGNKITLTK